MSTSFRDVARRVGPLRGGAVLMLLGTTSFVGGLVATTSSTGGGTSCPSGTELVAKFDWSWNRYRLTEGSGVNISNADEEGGSWSSSTPIAAIIVKGGPGSVTTTYAPAQSSGTFSQAGLPPVGSGRTPDISNVQFCRSTMVTTTTAKPTTTTAKVTTTTAKVTTTTAKATTTTAKATTTTAKATTTTAAPTTTAKVTTTTAKVTTTTAAPTTTAKATTTTAEATSTTKATTTTTAAPTTTTTAAPTTTTTAAPTTTTTQGEGTTTTKAESTSTTSTSVAPTTTTTTSKVGGTVVTSTSIVKDEAVVLGNEAERPLAVTGAPSIIMVTFGTLLFLLGGTMVAVTSLRRRRSEP